MNSRDLCTISLAFVLTAGSVLLHAQTSSKDLFNQGLSAAAAASNTDAAIEYFSEAAGNGYLPAAFCLGEIQELREDYTAAMDTFLSCVGNNRDAEYAIRRLMYFYPSISLTEKHVSRLTSLLPELTNHYTRALVNYTLGILNDVQGDYAEAGKYYYQLGPLTNWMITGGFDNAERTGLLKPFGPEKDISLAQMYEGKEWPVSWRPAYPLTRSGSILLEVIRPSEWITAYLRTGIVAPTNSSAILHVSFPGAFRIWHNGRPAAQVDRYGAYSPLQYRIPLNLPGGTNIIVCKVCSKSNGAVFSAWLHDTHNRPLDIQNIQPLDSTIPAACMNARQWPEPSPAPGLAYWNEYCSKTEDTYGEIMRGRYYTVLHEFDKGVETFEALEIKNMLCAADLYHLGNLYLQKDSASQAVSAFRKALGCDPAATAAGAAIASHYINRSLYDIAEPLLKDMLAEYPDSLDLRLELLSLYRSRKWLEDAYDLANDTRDKFPDYACVHRSLAFTTEQQNNQEEAEAAYREAFKCDQSGRDILYAIARIKRRRQQYDEYYRLLEEVRKMRPPSPAPYLSTINTLISTRDIPAGLQHCEKALAFFPDHTRLHKLQGDLLYMNGKRDKAIAAYKEALRFGPDYLWLRRYLDFLLKRDTSFFTEYAWSDAKVTSLIDHYRTKPAEYEEELTRMLLWNIMVQLYQDGSFRVMTHVVRQILNPKGLRAASSVNYSGELLKAVTHKQDGTILEATHMNRNQVEFPDVQVGDIIEYKYRRDHYGGSRFENNFYASYTFDLPQSEIVNADLAIAIPTNRQLLVDLANLGTTTITSRFDSRVVMQWSLTNVPMYRSEPKEPPYRDIARKISVSTLSNWNDIAKWQRGMWGDVTRGDLTVAELAQQIAGDATSDFDIINHIFKFVTENIRYTQLYETRIAGVKPHTIQDILANRCGDCKDMSLLTVELLKAMGITSHVTLLRTANNGQIVKDIPSPDVFNHAIVYIPGAGTNGLFVDPTFRHGEYDILPPVCQTVSAFVITDDGYEFITTPRCRPIDNHNSMKLQCVLSADGSCTGALQYMIWRNGAASFRGMLENVPQTRNIGALFVSMIDPAGSVEDFTLENRDPGPDPVIMNVAFSAPRFARTHNGTLSLTLPFPIEAERVHGGLEERHHPLKYLLPDYQSEEFLITIPEGYSVDIPVAEKVRETPFGTFSFKTEVDGTDLHVRWEFILTAMDIPVEDYPAFRDFIAESAHITSQVITLKPE
jgi:tetratricopeptide (TPR) repeat protein/transglutaminase-like putative cysteine protease